MAIKKIQKQEQEQKPEELHNFYTAFYNGEVKIRFDKLKVLNLLRNLGYIWYVPETTDEAKKGMIIRIRDNRIRVVDIVNAQYAFRDYIRKLPDYPREFAKKSYDEEGKPSMEPFKFTITPQLIETKMIDNLANLFGGDLMYHLRVDENDNFLKIKEDTINEKFLYFNNTAVCVTADGWQLIPYKDLTGGCVWESSILDHDFEYTEEIGDFESFVGDICGYDPESTNKEEIAVGRERKRSLMTILGYLMHNNYECTRRAVIFTDMNKEDASESNGRTGKGLLGKALRAVLNRKESDCRYLVIPGKGFEFKDTRYSAGDISTQLIHIEDVETKKSDDPTHEVIKFDFERFFNDVTDGCTFRKLHQNPTIHNCKMMISTNHTINVLTSESKRGRVCIFELTNYYNADFEPDMKYNRRFFESKWEERDWLQFYSFMIRCAQAYMKYGLVQPDMVNYASRVIADQLPGDLVTFLDMKLKETILKRKRREINKRDWFNALIVKYPYFAKYQQPAFTKWCTQYFKLNRIPSAHTRTTRDNDYVEMFLLYPNPEDSVFKWIYKEGKKNTGNVKQAKIEGL